jgi:predicted 3-demethylubiquinone-9 3-methyltransferase (glyoxalase superfamily)
VKKITPHLWFDKEAVEAATFYTSVFENSKITHTATLHDTPSGDCDIVSFELSGQPFMAISAGPLFKFNPSISFHVKCKTKEETEVIWKKLSAGGSVLMEFGKYPFSELYGWCSDRYGLSWQIIYAGDKPFGQKIVPVLMFTNDVCGKAEEAVKFYTSIFPKGSVDMVVRYGKGEAPDKEGTVKYTSFKLNSQDFGAMDSAHEHKFDFNEAVSLLVPCDTQKEIDHYWEKMSAVPESEQCGWLKDKFGVSWQISSSAMEKMMSDKDEKKVARLTKAFLKMKKFDIEALKRVYEGS